MNYYQPPFAINKKMLGLTAEISEKIGRIHHLHGFSGRPQLRRLNRIRSIHASLAIEENSLTLNEVRDIISGREVFGPPKDIQEVKNAYRAYEELPRTDPYSIEELKRIHGIMGFLTVAEAGEFRSREEGVFDGDKCIFMAPPARFVPQLMQELFLWLQKERGRLHPLLLSSIFHYEFVFIHPFADGNGRMARLWQTALLSAWQPLFQYLPLENQIKSFQQEYYAAIAKCHAAGSSDFFIEFMLEKINAALEQAAASADNGSLTPNLQKLMQVMQPGRFYSAQELLQLLQLKSRDALRKNYLQPALKLLLVSMTEPEKPTSRNQRYYKA